MPLFLYKKYTEGFALQHILFYLCAPEIYEIFVYKLTETMEYVRYENYILHGQITTQLLGLIMRKVIVISGYCFYMNPNRVKFSNLY